MKNKIKTYIAVSFVLALTIAAVRTVSLMSFYDTDIGYFNGTFLTTAMNALYILSALWCLSPIVLIPSSKIKTEFTPNVFALKPISAFAAVLFVLSALYTLSETSPSKIQATGAAFTAISALFFIFALSNNDKYKIIRAFASMALAIALILTLAALYFDMTIAMNSPNKILGIFAIMSAMIFTLCETRTYLGTQLPRIHFASALLTLVLGSSLTLSSLLYILITRPTAFVTNPIILGNIAHIAVIAGISAYASVRCFTFEAATENSEYKAEQ